MSTSELLRLCRNRLESFSDATKQIDYRHDGIYPSELLLFSTLCDAFSVDLIIESGTGLGYSTECLAALYPAKSICSIEVDARKASEENANSRTYAQLREKMMATHQNVHLNVGDASRFLPEIIKASPQAKVGVLIDGPKDSLALQLARHALAHDNVCFVCVCHVSQAIDEGKTHASFLADAACCFLSHDDNAFDDSVNRMDAQALSKGNWLASEGRRAGMAVMMSPAGQAFLGLTPLAQAKAPISTAAPAHPASVAVPNNPQFNQKFIRSGALSNDLTSPVDFEPPYSREFLSECTLDELADIYGTDKGSIKHNYTPVYERVLREYAPERMTARLAIAEIGVACGASLKMWSSYLPKASITGFDVRPECAKLCRSYPQVRIEIGDPRRYSTAPGLFDMIIDDASHIAEDIVSNFYHCIQWVKPGGMYVIEDIDCTYNQQYAKQHRSQFDRPEIINSRFSVLEMMDTLMRSCDADNVIRSFEYHPRMVVIRKR